jgi:hypothetical protein
MFKIQLSTSSAVGLPGFFRGAWLVVVAALLVFAPESAAQGNVSGRRFLQSGVAAFPGVGLQLGYVGRHSFYTVEGMASADGQPSLGEGESTLRVSGGLGAAMRPLGVVRTIGNADYPYDFDLGARFGPSLFFTTGATRADKNQQFSLFLDFFLRFSSRFRNGRIFFLELGTQQPNVRAGLWFGL